MFKHVLRGLVVFAIGLCLVIWSKDAGEILLKAMGISLIISAIVTLAIGLASNVFNVFKTITVVTVLSAALLIAGGVLLLVKTDAFLTRISYVLGVILALYGLLQIIHTIIISKGMTGRVWLFFVPLIIFGVGITLCIYPLQTIETICIISGVCLMLLGIVELVMDYKIYTLKQRFKAKVREEAERIRNNKQNIVVEVIEPENTSAGATTEVETTGSTAEAAGAATESETSAADVTTEAPGASTEASGSATDAQ